jgi:uncharacterized repeat protein (TIGR04138 family)
MLERLLFRKSCFFDNIPTVYDVEVLAVARNMTQEIHPLVKLLCEDRRFKLEAYRFVQAGLTYAQEVLGLGGEEVEASSPRSRKATAKARAIRHVTGQDLCHALRQFAHQEYGLMAKLVLADWGVRSTSDFGEIVYNFIKIGTMSKSPHDRREDFDDVFDFDAALVREYEFEKVEA